MSRSRSRRKCALGLALALVFGFAAVLLAAGKEDLLPPKPTRYVTDRAGALPADRAEQLNARLEKFEEDTSNQLLVWIDRRVPEGWDVNSFATAALRKWGIGQKDKNNGILVVVFVEDRKMWIEVGYGLEGTLPDATANEIAEGMRSRFRQGDYAGGVEAGAAAIIAATKGEYKGSGTTVAQRQHRYSRRGSSPSFSGCLVPGLFFFFFVLVPILSRLGSHRWRTFGGGGWWTGGGWGGGGWGGGGGGGGFSGGGFSGGGGSSGGGGAGGGW